ncbi:MAG: DUF1684 domain-containing protein [Longimicrobiales bacterium]
MRTSFPGWLLLAPGLFLSSGGCENPPPPPPLSSPQEHQAEIEAWQARRVAELKEPDSWLSVVGLFWLKPGENTIGSDPRMDVVFPGRDVPPFLGTLTLRGHGSFEFSHAAGVGTSPPPWGAEPAPGTGEAVRFRVDSPEGGPVFRWGTLSWFVIERYGEYAIRLRDSDSEALAEFRGLERFPVNSDWRVLGRFHRYDPPREIATPNVLDIPSTSASPGAVVFQVEGEEYRLDVTGEPDARSFFVVFGDATNREETYPGGRFLSIGPLLDGDWIVIDFNRAYNPPCVFTPYATCPVPPDQNKLPVRIEAGEKMYYGAGH